MKAIMITLFGALVLVAAGCGSIFDDDDLARQSDQCWVEIHEDADFVRDKPWTRIQGPSEIESLDKLAGYDWNDKISSIRVGPDAIVQVYEHAKFRGEVREYGYGRYIDNLDDDRLNDRVSSIKIRCR